jgi:hypothetical protein
MSRLVRADEPHTMLFIGKKRMGVHLCDICDEDTSDPRHLRRVEFRKANRHIHDRETFMVKAYYLTHAVRWEIVETDHPKDADEGYLRKLGFQDRDGNWWLVWFSFHNTDGQAYEWETRNLQERAEGRYSDENIWIGTL